MKEAFKKYDEIIRYLIIGILTTLVSLLVYYGLTLTILDPNNAILLQIANVISWVCSVLFAYFTNRSFVFKSKNPKKLKELCTFFMTRVSTLLCDMAIMFIFVSALGWNDKIIKIISQIVVIIGNYVLSKLFVFKK